MVGTPVVVVEETVGLAVVMVIMMVQVLSVKEILHQYHHHKEIMDFLVQQLVLLVVVEVLLLVDLGQHLLSLEHQQLMLVEVGVLDLNTHLVVEDLEEVVVVAMVDLPLA